ncbi:MAG: hypothetical protein QOK43_2172 [Acidimicrobiaceae bacterium]|nr:hypothetical protein [Acidimicrobiaceae bacterium]
MAAVGLAGWGALFAYSTDRAEARRGVDVDEIVGDRCSYDRRTDPGRTHVESPRYTVDPPSGGPHSARPASPGFKEPAATPSDGELVHAMEHGFVVVWYSPGDSAVEELRALARQERGIIAVARPGMTARIAVTAWGRRLLCDSVDVGQIRRFVRAFAGRGPERVAI